MSNFLQQHYDHYRTAGGDHASYVVVNDLSEELADELRATFEENHPPVSKEKQREFSERLSKEAEAAKARDDFEWYTGTGYYGQ